MSRPCILVVEDEAIVARDIARQAVELGYTVAGTAARGAEAIELAERLHPDLVLMDIQLADAVDGITAAQQIRARFGTPVVFLTAFASPPVMQRAKSASPFGYLVKPFDPVQLGAAIEMALHQHEVETNLRESREELATILRTAMDAFWMNDLDGQILEVNEATCLLLGHSRDEMLRLRVADIELSESVEMVIAHIAKVKREGGGRFESRYRKRDGAVIEVEVSLKYLPVGAGRIFCFFRDITERKRAEAEREVTVRLLSLINGQNDLHGLMQAATTLLRDWSGCEAVGIRLREGDDFPYFETHGFPAAVVAAESFLCQRDAAGQVVRDAAGNPELECMCGNILCGRVDAAKPFFTAHGSFWTNSTTDLLASTTEADRQARTRNRCHGEGYESVALVPLRVSETTYGLLQFNDSRRDRFTLERITLLERLGDSLAVAIAQRQAQAALRASEARFRQLIESTTDYVYSVEHRSDGLVQTRHGPGCLKVTGYSPVDFASHPRLWLEMVPTEDRAAVEAYATRLTAGEQPPPLEHRITHRDGSTRWVESSVVVRQAIAPGGLIHEGVITDITARKQAEVRLRASEEKFAKAFHSAPVMITLSTLEDGTFLEINEASVRSFGFSQEEVLGKTSVGLGLLRAADRQRLLKSLNSEGRISGLELTLTAKNGRQLECIYSGEVVAIDGQARLLSIILDTTERKRLETQFRQAQKMEAVGQLAGGVAHDFNNILVAILLHLGLLREEKALDAETHSMLLELEREATRAASLTRQLLAFSRRQVMQVKPVHLNDLLTNLLKMVRRLIGENIAVVLRDSPGLPVVLADPGMIEQVVVNLCVNARDAMAGGGKLTLATEAAELSEAEAHANPDVRAGRYVRLSVSDTGCGMDDATRAHLFEPFFTTKEVGKGTGLGLATVYGIVKQHGGWVEVESTVDRGSVFRVLLPAAAFGVAEGGKEHAPLMPRGRNETILIVEDEPSVRIVMAATLRRYGYLVLEARNGSDAEGRWSEHEAEIDLLLTDIVMPGGVSGVELAARLRVQRPTLRVVFCSGYSQTQTVPSGPGLGTLPKPFETSVLLGTVRKCLDDPVTTVSPN